MFNTGVDNLSEAHYGQYDWCMFTLKRVQLQYVDVYISQWQISLVNIISFTLSFT